jgi:hypothetical protein
VLLYFIIFLQSTLSLSLRVNARNLQIMSIAINEESINGEPFGFIESTHGGHILVRRGQRYHFHRENKDGSLVWRCHIRSCSGNIKINSQKTIVIREQAHDVCVPDFQSTEIEKKFVQLKKKVQVDFSPMPSLYNSEMACFRQEEFADKLPSFYTIRDTLYRSRRNGVEKLQFNSCEEVEIPENLSKDFLIVNKYGMTIFATPETKKYIAQVDTYFLDGTFKVTPHPYTQLYTILGGVGSTQELTK